MKIPNEILKMISMFCFSNRREYTPPPDYSQFKVGKSSYTEEFKPREPMKNTMIAPLSRYRVNKPHPRIHNVQNYPNAVSSSWILIIIKYKEIAPIFKASSSLGSVLYSERVGGNDPPYSPVLAFSVASSKLHRNIKSYKTWINHVWHVRT